MRENLHKHILVATILVLTALALVGGTWYVHYNQSELEAAIRTQLDSERATLLSLAEITDRNGADDVISSIIVDCPRRVEFENLLTKLDTLFTKDLITLQMLYESCGAFYAERKALMVSKIESEYTMYTRLVTLLMKLTLHDIERYNVAEWGELVELEKTRSALLTEQTKIQLEIISALISNRNIESQSIRDLAHEASQIYQLLSVHSTQIDEKRELLKK